MGAVKVGIGLGIDGPMVGILVGGVSGVLVGAVDGSGRVAVGNTVTAKAGVEVLTRVPPGCAPCPMGVRVTVGDAVTVLAAAGVRKSTSPATSAGKD